MKLKHYLLVLLNITIGLLHAQSLAWHENIGSRFKNWHEYRNNIVIIQMESDSNFVYVLGAYDRSLLDFYQNQQKVPFSPAYPNAFLAQFDHSGKLNWVQSLGRSTPFTKYRNHIMTLNKGHIYLSGSFTYQTLIGTDTLKTQYASVYLAKFNENGQKIWHKVSEPTYWTNDNEPKNLTVDYQNNIYLSGEMRGTRPLTFDSVSCRLTDRQFVFKFDNTGKPLWATSAHKLDLDHKWTLDVIDSQVDTQNNLFLLMTGGTRGTSSTCAFSTWQSVIMRVTPQGKMDSLCAIRCSDLMSATAFALAENGDMYLAGRYRGQLTIGNFKSEDKGCKKATAFVARVTAKGRLIWFREGHLGEFSDIYQLKTEKEGNLLVMGRQDYKKNKSEDGFRYPNYPAPYPDGEQRIFLKRLSPFGVSIDSIEWYTSDYSRDDYEFENMDFTQSPQGNIFVGIEYTCKLDTFSHSLCSEGRVTTPDSTFEAAGSKLLIGRLGDKVFQKKQLAPALAENQFRIFPNPTNDFIFMESKLPIQETVMATLYDMNGRIIQEIMYDEKNKFRGMEMANQPTGIYLLVIRKDGNPIFSTKILKI